MARKKKRKLPNALKITRQCALEVGIKPFKKWTKAQKKKVAACRARKSR